MSNRLFVGNLAFSTTEDSLRNAFGQFGVVSEVKLMVDRETGRSRGFAFVEMSSPDEAKKAMEGLSGQALDGRPIRVDAAEPRRERPGGGGGPRPGGGGGFRGAPPPGAPGAAPGRPPGRPGEGRGGERGFDRDGRSDRDGRGDRGFDRDKDRGGGGFGRGFDFDGDRGGGRPRRGGGGGRR